MSFALFKDKATIYSRQTAGTEVRRLPRVRLTVTAREDGSAEADMTVPIYGQGLRYLPAPEETAGRGDAERCFTIRAGDLFTAGEVSPLFTVTEVTERLHGSRRLRHLAVKGHYQPASEEEGIA